MADTGAEPMRALSLPEDAAATVWEISLDLKQEERRIAYFTMEVGLNARMPTYSGGLGVLAGDSLRAAADLALPMVGVTLLHRRGYCHQHIDEQGNQSERQVEWNVADHLEEIDGRACVTIEGRDVFVRAWTLELTGHCAHGAVDRGVTVLFLDTDLPENDELHRRITDTLYGGDDRYRLMQEAVLGIGGVRMLRSLGYDCIERFHMNEGHAALLTCALLAEHAGADLPSTEHERAVQEQCVFTTHTPVPAGHDRFPADLVQEVLGDRTVAILQRLGVLDGELDMTDLAARLSRYTNGVARRHGVISRRLIGSEDVDSITNGVHARTWAAPPIADLFDQHLPDWREESLVLRNALAIPGHELWKAHCAAKEELFAHVERSAHVHLDREVFTIGAARRAATYKRADLIFENIDRLLRIQDATPGLQILFAGKAHPADGAGKEVIRRVCEYARSLEGRLRVLYLEDYDMKLGRLLTAGCDLWLNTPEPPMEASGTSGMKAALNGVPSLSVLDGWWLEGCIEGVTGWAVGGDDADDPKPREEVAENMYEKLEHIILPLYYRERTRFYDVMRHCIALNGSYFNTQRMMSQYLRKAYYG